MTRRLEADYPPVRRDQAAALRTYAALHGRSWKHRLWIEWMNASAEPILHSLRNTHGCTWLERLRLSTLPEPTPGQTARPPEQG